MIDGVTVVIPAFNRARDLPETLAAIAEQTVRPRCVIVVDNRSADDTRLVVQSCVPRFAALGIALEYVLNEPLGPASARNVGWKRAETEYVAFVDSDVTLERSWIAVCQSELKNAADLGAVAGKVLYAHRTDLTNSFGGEISPIGLAWDADEGATADVDRQSKFVVWANCSALMARTAALAQVDGFDDTFFYGFEDSDLGWRLNLYGWRVTAIPAATSMHRVGLENGPAAPLITFHSCKNRLRSMLVNCGTLRLPIYMSAYLTYAVADILLRPPRHPKVNALWWNVLRLPQTIMRRRLVQKNRRISDRQLLRMFSKRWFPEHRLDGLRRRPVDSMQPIIPLRQDDRV